MEYGAALPEHRRSGSGFPVFGSSGEIGRHSRAMVNGPGIVVGRKGTVGAIEWSDEDFWPIDTTYFVVPKREAEKRWLYWVLKAANLKTLDASTGVPGLNRNDVYGLPVPCPSLDEQARIAAVLDAVDDAIAKTEAVIAKLKQVRAGLVHDLLTRGLDENGELRDPVAHPEQFKDSPLGRIPREWEVRRIEELLARIPNALRSGPFGSALLKQELRPTGIPLLGIDNVHVERFVPLYTRFVDEQKFLELRRYAVRPGDVMITIMGTVGRCCVVPDSVGTALSSKHVWTITFDPKRYSPFLACWQMNFAPWVLQQFRRDEQGGTMSAIRSETIRTLLLPVPPPQEMGEIERLWREVTDAVSTEEAALPKLQALKSGLLSDLLTGRVRVPEDILADEKSEAAA